jgi:E3 ubiquitin-protein ligase ATL6/9/15/31/42/55
VCQCDFEADEMLKVLPSCGHAYHQDCIDQWLSGSKVKTAGTAVKAR